MVGSWPWRPVQILCMGLQVPKWASCHVSRYHRYCYAHVSLTTPWDTEQITKCDYSPSSNFSTNIISPAHFMATVPTPIKGLRPCRLRLYRDVSTSIHTKKVFFDLWPQSVTAFGRQMIAQSKNLIEQKYCIANGYPYDAKVQIIAHIYEHSYELPSKCMWHLALFYCPWRGRC